jgi:hypothetical protein
MAARDRGLRITLNRDQLAVLVVNQLAATYSAIGANGARNLSAKRFGAQIFGAGAHGFRSGSIGTGLELADNRPTGEKVFEHSSTP